MKVSANDIRPGWVLEYKGRQYSVLKMNTVKPGKGGAFAQVEMRDIQSGSKINERFRTEDTLEKLMVEEKDCQYLFESDDQLNFMDSQTYEQFAVPKELAGDGIAFLQDGMTVQISFIEGKPVSLQLPKTIVDEVIETEPVVKGQTAASSAKPALLSNRVRVMVPPFVNVGDKVVVNTETGEYVERAKN